MNYDFWQHTGLITRPPASVLTVSLFTTVPQKYSEMSVSVPNEITRWIKHLMLALMQRETSITWTERLLPNFFPLETTPDETFRLQRLVYEVGFF